MDADYEAGGSSSRGGSNNGIINNNNSNINGSGNSRLNNRGMQLGAGLHHSCAVVGGIL